jgi:hypothetical protein
MNKISFEKYIELQVMLIANYRYNVSTNGFCPETLSENEAKELVDRILNQNNCEVVYEQEMATSSRLGGHFRKVMNSLERYAPIIFAMLASALFIKLIIGA